jgi:hypothetical protein
MTKISPLEYIFKCCDLETDFGWDHKESTSGTAEVNCPYKYSPC